MNGMVLVGRDCFEEEEMDRESRESGDQHLESLSECRWT